MTPPTAALPIADCAECGMPCTTGEYHPYAACLMFKACHDSGVVRANLTAVRAPAVQATADADELAREIAALIDRETYSPGRRLESIAAIVRKHSALPPKDARELNLKWGRHDGRGEYHIEWHAPCGCAYHPEPNPHVHPCIKHSPVDDPLYTLREMWLDFPGLGVGSLSTRCIREMSPEQADFYAAACDAAKSAASPAAVSGDKQEKER